MDRVEGYQERIVYIDGDSVSCSGENNDHPKVYLRIPHDGHYVVCNYYDTKFARLEKEYGGPKGAEPTRFGTWENKGREIDF